MQLRALDYICDHVQTHACTYLKLSLQLHYAYAFIFLEIAAEKLEAEATAKTFSLLGAHGPEFQLLLHTACVP